MKRVVVTGLGAVTPVGNDIPTFWENLSNGVSGIGLIHHFDTADYKAKVAAEVKDFDITRYVDKMAAKRLDLFSQYAVSAAQQAMEDSGLACDPERLGVYIGSGIGGLSTMVREEEKLLKSGPHRVSPMTIPMMIANLPAGRDRLRHRHQRHRRSLPHHRGRLGRRDPRGRHRGFDHHAGGRRLYRLHGSDPER